MNKFIMLMALGALIITGCKAQHVSSCGNGEYTPPTIEITSVMAQFSQQEESSYNNLHPPTLLDLDKGHAAGDVLFNLSVNTQYTSNTITTLRFSLFKQALACSPPPPSITHGVASVRVFIHSASNPHETEGLEVTDQLNILSQSNRSSSIPLMDWNSLDNKRQSPHRNPTGIAVLSFAEPANVLPGTNTYHIMVTLTNGDLWEPTLPAITLQ